jgi:hypothetical protein
VPPGRPKPLEHPVDEAADRLIEVAVTAPVLSAEPTARAHLPTARSAEVAVALTVNVVAEVRVTTTLEVALVVGSVSLTVTVEPSTAVTRPEAAPKDPPPGAPDGRLPLPEVGGLPSPAGGVPPPGGVPPEGNPPPAAPPPPPKPEVQAPETGWVIETVVAVTGPVGRFDVDFAVDFAVDFDVVPFVGLPKAEMHDPTVTAAAVVDELCWNVVVAV